MCIYARNNDARIRQCNYDARAYGVATGSSGFSVDVPFSILPVETLQVDVWTGLAWQNVFTALTYGWNNVTIAPYLTSSIFTIRYHSTFETNDSIQDSWQIAAALLHVWS